MKPRISVYGKVYISNLEVIKNLIFQFGCGFPKVERLYIYVVHQWWVRMKIEISKFKPR